MINSKFKQKAISNIGPSVILGKFIKGTVRFSSTRRIEKLKIKI